ncbi:N-terminal domain of NEFA-interacting nuclear protein NIP30-domain-containing protein [Lenzites betulinus]|nr:N-terminal domain of NEFA-interacting nuclear protein NIP30-domain-containing protein [Lenzites betulinus]
MDDAIPSIQTSGVGSRFVSQSDLEVAKAKRDEQWKAAYARLGQEPPPQPADDAFDGRSLAEKLAANRAAKQEEWEERNKLGNQFRALEEDEVLFLDSVLEKQREEERLRKEMDGEELKHFREAVAARESATSKPPPIGAAAVTVSPPPAAAKPSTAPAKKDAKKALKGVLVKKKSKPAAAKASTAAQTQPPKAQPKEEGRKSNEKVGGDERDAKRRKVAES